MQAHGSDRCQARIDRSMRCKAPESGNQTAACVQNHTELTFLTERNPKNLCVQKRPGELLLGIFAKIEFVQKTSLS